MKWLDTTGGAENPTKSRMLTLFVFKLMKEFTIKTIDEGVSCQGAPMMCRNSGYKDPAPMMCRNSGYKDPAPNEALNKTQKVA